MGLRTIALSATTAAVLAASALLAGAAPASAEQLGCTDPNFAKIVLHDDSGFKQDRWCYANAGTYETPWWDEIWVDSLSTGNNVVRLQDCDGTWYGWHDRDTLTFWALYNQPRICHLQIQ